MLSLRKVSTLKTPFFYIVLISSFVFTKSTLPIAVFHGLGDSCSFPGTADFVDYLKEKLHTEVICIEQGNGFLTSWFTKFQKQSEMACESVRNNPIFNGEFSVLGISQGALIARYIIQKCEMKGKVKNFVSISGPHMGTAGVPRLKCGWFCNMINKTFGKFVYFGVVQDHLAPAGYFKDRYNLDGYKEMSTFLSDLNNEKDIKNNKYKERFSQLEKTVFVMNEHDTALSPPSTAWFEFYDGSTNTVVPLRESAFYKDDFIGLKELDEKRRVNFVILSGDHIHFSDYDIDTYMIPVLK